MKQSFVRVLAMYLFSFTCFSCTTNIDNLMDGGTSIVESSPTLIAEVKATTHFLGWGNVGDTTINVKADKDILPALTGKKVDVSSITRNTEGFFRLLSVGGSLSAGFRDGGLYRAGQVTAFPNLVARQMGVTLNQPLFDANEGNGSGYKTLVGTEPIATFKMVTNNLGYVDSKAERLKKFTGTNLDSYAFPEIRKQMEYTSLDQKYVDRLISDASKSNYKSPLDLIKQQSADFVIFELGSDDLVRGALVALGGGINDFYQGLISLPSEQSLLKDMSNKKIKGIILNVPYVLDFPYFNQFPSEKIKKLGIQLEVQESRGSDRYRLFDYSTDRLVPTKNVEELFRGKVKVGIQLKDSDVISRAYDGKTELQDLDPTSYNTFELQKRAKEINWPVVDVYNIYKKILAGSYTTDDGVKVNPDWVKGNFFSSDGIYPTAFGQAVITNEVIKTMNQHYILCVG